MWENFNFGVPISSLYCYFIWPRTVLVYVRVSLQATINCIGQVWILQTHLLDIAFNHYYWAVDLSWVFNGKCLTCHVQHARRNIHMTRRCMLTALGEMTHRICMSLWFRSTGVSSIFTYLFDLFTLINGQS